MSLLVIGVSHHDAPMSLLEAVALDAAGQSTLETHLLHTENVSEAIVVSTCNRTEVYVEALTFHGAVADVTEALAISSGMPRAELQPHLYLHYEDRGIAHAFGVAAGLDSMAVGEAQVLGQLRGALTRAQRHGHVGPGLNMLFQWALRVGKRVHTETEIDAVSHSLVSAGLDHAASVLGSVGGCTVAVVGAGGMGALAAKAASREGAARLWVLNRSPERAEHLAERVGGTARPMADLVDVLAESDVVLAATGAKGAIVSVADAAAALGIRGGRPQIYIDLALPHDIETAVGELPGITRLGLAELGVLLSGTADTPQVQQARDLVTAEVAEYILAGAAESVVPTVAALRARAAEVLEQELVRLEHRTPDLSEAERAEVRRAAHRIVEKLLHTPTVRVKELARSGLGASYAQALSELFDLTPAQRRLVETPPRFPGDLT
jgi:glutamyl-tRNA reductase